MSQKNSNSPISILSSGLYPHLDRHLNAYSVYPTKPPEDCPLFQLVFVHPSSRHRENSPALTALNLQAVFHNLRAFSDVYGSAGRALLGSIRAFRSHFGQTLSRHRGAPLQRVETGDKIVGGRGKRGDISAGEFGGFQIGVKDESGIDSSMVIKVKKWEKYSGAGLKHLIMSNSTALMRVFLLELYDSFNFRVGERVLFAVVTKNIVLDIDMEYSAVVGSKKHAAIRALTGLVGMGIGIGAENRSKVEKRTVRRDRARLGGLHMIVFKICRTSSKKWTLNGGVDVSTSNDDSATIAGGMKHLKQWVKSQSTSSNYAAAKSGNVRTGRNRNSDNGNYQRPGSESDPSSYHSMSGASDDESSDDEYVDVSFDEDDCVTIDLSDDIQQFAKDQLNLAKYYEEKAETEKDREHVVSLVRSVLRHVEYESTIDALKSLADYHKSGFGVAKNVHFAESLGECANYLQGNVEDLWEVIRQDFQDFPNQPTPEKRIVDQCVLDMSNKPEEYQRLVATASRIYDASWKGGVLRHLYLEYLEQEGVIEKKTSIRLPSSTVPDAFRFYEQALMNGMNNAYETQSVRRCTPNSSSLDDEMINSKLPRTELIEATKQYKPIPDFPWRLL